MPGMIDAMLQELEQESQATERVLQAVPEDRLGWKPHEKSMSLGQLAYHIANNAGQITDMVKVDTYEMQGFGFPEPSSKQEIMDLFHEKNAYAKKELSGLGDEALQANWSATKNGEPFFSMPRGGVLRMILLNHLYHHRGQLTVYLRLLDIPVPSVYGPTADENPFAEMQAEAKAV